LYPYEVDALCLSPEYLALFPGHLLSQVGSTYLTSEHDGKEELT